MSKTKSGTHAVSRSERRHTRTPVDLPVTVTVPDAEPIEGRVTNIGQGGAFIAGPLPPFGAQVVLDIQVPGEKPLELRAVVRWCDDSGFGVQFMAVGVRQTALLGRLSAA